MNKSNIAIVTTVVNFELYNITSKFFPSGISKYVIDGRNGMHGIDSIFYMFDKLSNKNIDWLILADEDVVFNDSNLVFSILQKMNEEQICVSGVRDGGVISHRHYNPIMVNTFFVIINFKEILEIWDKSAVRKNQYILSDEFKMKQGELKGGFNIDSLYEPYYCFFLWLKRNNKRFLYLEAQMLDDGISNNILFEGKVFACHTWYARSYKVNKKHTDRINKILHQLKNEVALTILDTNIIIFKDRFFYMKMKLKKGFNRVVNKLKK